MGYAKRQSELISSMPHDERREYFASAKRVSAKQVFQFNKGQIDCFWAGVIRGVFAPDEDGNFKFDNKEDALEAARKFRERCRNDLSKSIPRL